MSLQELASEIWINYVAPKLPPDDPLRVIQNNFKNSLNIIRTFGRFPHRNDLLGRKTTDLEVICDQPLKISSWKWNFRLHFWRRFDPKKDSQ